jgi:5-methylcytosine-specific restriction protein A
MKKVTCAGCMNYFEVVNTTMYRKKRCCGSVDCFAVIDEKIKAFNYRKKQQRMEKGTFRHGVSKELREKILIRDNNRCRLCKYRFNESYSVQIHHVVPVSHGGDDNELNLCTLCKDCHTKVHNDGWEKYVFTFKVSSEQMEKRKISA